MELLINGRFLTQRITGVQRYAIELVKGLDELLSQGMLNADPVSFKILTPKNILTELPLKNIEIETVGRLTGHLWEQAELPIYAKNKTLLNLGNTSPILKKDQITTLHDVSVFAVPEAYSRAFRSWYQFLFKRLSQSRNPLITVSNFSKQEIINYLHIPEETIAVTYEGKEHILAIETDTSILSAHNLDQEKFILAVSSQSPHKNFSAIVQSLNYLSDLKNLKVVIIGGANQQIFANANLRTLDQVIPLGYVTDAQLKSLYENAIAFVHASIYEGFGLPPLEAMACGCPTIVSKAASMPEVCEQAALYFDPYNPEAIADQIRRVTTDSNLRLELKHKAIAQSQKFSWKKCAQETIDVARSHNTINSKSH